MKILCPNGIVLHSDAAMQIAIDFVPALVKPIDTIDDKQIRVSTNADYIVESDVWDSWIYSVGLLVRLMPRLANIVTLNTKLSTSQLTTHFDTHFGDLLEKVVNVIKLDQLPPLVLNLHHMLDDKDNGFLADEIDSQAKIEATIFTKKQDYLKENGLYKQEYDALFNTPKVSYISIVLSETQNQIFNIYLPDDDEQKEIIFEIIRNAQIQLAPYHDAAVADFITDSITVIEWFNEIFSFYRLKLKIEAYKEIKYVERYQEQFIAHSEDIDEILRDVSRSQDNPEGSDKNYFMLNKLSGFLNAFDYEQTILHPVTDMSDFKELPNKQGYYTDFI